MKTFTKPIFAIGFGVLIMTSAASSAPQPGIEFLGHPEINGKPLPFSDAVRVGDVLYLSGQIGVGPDGKLPSEITAQTEQAMENIGAVLKRAGLGYEHLFHCTAFLADMNDWAAFKQFTCVIFRAEGCPLEVRSEPMDLRSTRNWKSNARLTQGGWTRRVPPQARSLLRHRCKGLQHRASSRGPGALR